MHEIPQYSGPLIRLIFLAGVLGLFAWTIRVCAVDARYRGKSPRLDTLLVLCSFPLILILWLLLHPDPTNPNDKEFCLTDRRGQ